MRAMLSRYLSKYLTKELLLSAPLRSRRVTTSQGIKLSEQDAKTDANIFRTSLDQLLKKARNPHSIRFDDDGVTLVSFAVDHDITRWRPGDTPNRLELATMAGLMPTRSEKTAGPAVCEGNRPPRPEAARLYTK